MTLPIGPAAAGATAAPAVPAAPAARRGAAGPDAELTKAGEAFERAMVGQLTRALTESAFGGEDATSAASGAYKDLLPDALTDALVSGGGIGLARALDRGPLS
jgi:Rod binding domain-containing protein